jgi:hypothetical protein
LNDRAIDDSVTALERAFQIAKSGDCKSVSDLRKQLRKEGYSLDKITGRTLCGLSRPPAATAAPRTHDHRGIRQGIPPHWYLALGRRDSGSGGVTTHRLRGKKKEIRWPMKQPMLKPEDGATFHGGIEKRGGLFKAWCRAELEAGGRWSAESRE